jgi:hypothetical protein
MNKREKAKEIRKFLLDMIEDCRKEARELTPDEQKLFDEQKNELIAVAEELKKSEDVLDELEKTLPEIEAAAEKPSEEEEKPAEEPEQPAGEQPAAEPEPPKKKLAAKKKPEQTELSPDDLIRVVTQKIKKDRSNKEKVLALLKSYGAAKVSDIPPDKYEAFLTVVSQL